MRNLICLVLAVFIVGLPVLPAMAAQEGPEITMQPQSPSYPQYSVAMYTVKAEGTNMTATWYMEWLGKTYRISDIGVVTQDWEVYAGAGYGARRLDDNTFAFIFEGIEYDLDGAYIWCVIEDGHYEVTSQRARITVGDYSSPPVILSIPARLTAQQGAQAEIRCVASSADGSQLSFLWYETDTGRLEDIYAVNRGTETTDYMFCDTSSLGTRNYICLVETSNGGLAYSSMVPVTVTEKEQTPAPTQPPPTVQPTQPPEPETQATEPTQDIQDTTAPSQTGSLDTSTPTKTEQQTTEASQPIRTAPEQDTQGEIPGWALVLIGVGAAGAGVGTAIILTRKNHKSGGRIMGIGDFFKKTFGKQTCAFCGSEVGMMKRDKIKNGEFICSDCKRTCSRHIQVYRLTKDELLGHMEYMKRQARLVQAMESLKGRRIPSAGRQGILFYDEVGMFRIYDVDQDHRYAMEMIRYDQVARYEPYIEESEPDEPGKEKVFGECGVKLTLVGAAEDLSQIPKGLRTHPYITQEITVKINDRDKHIGELDVNQIISHFNSIFGVNDSTKGLFSFGPTVQQKREREAMKAMGGMFKEAIKAAKTGEVSADAMAQVNDAMNKVDDAATGGLARYSRLADEAEAKI